MMNEPDISNIFVVGANSLAQNPFGKLPCFMLGVFYPFYPCEELKEFQRALIRHLAGGKQVWIFDGEFKPNLEPVAGDLFCSIALRVSATDQLTDVNLYFPYTRSAICISHSESVLFCTSKDRLTQNLIREVTRENSHTIQRSIQELERHLLVLSGKIPKYFE